MIIETTKEDILEPFLYIVYRLSQKEEEVLDYEFQQKSRKASNQEVERMLELEMANWKDREKRTEARETALPPTKSKFEGLIADRRRRCDNLDQETQLLSEDESLMYYPLTQLSGYLLIDLVHFVKIWMEEFVRNPKSDRKYGEILGSIEDQDVEFLNNIVKVPEDPKAKEAFIKVHDSWRNLSGNLERLSRKITQSVQEISAGIRDLNKDILHEETTGQLTTPQMTAKIQELRETRTQLRQLMRKGEDHVMWLLRLRVMMTTFYSWVTQEVLYEDINRDWREEGGKRSQEYDIEGDTLVYMLEARAQYALFETPALKQLKGEVLGEVMLRLKKFQDTSKRLDTVLSEPGSSWSGNNSRRNRSSSCSS